MRASRYYKQEITYWPPLGGDDGYGNLNVGTPVTFLGRWEDKEVTFLSNRGEQVVSKAIIHFPKNINILPDGYVCQGRILAAAGPPKDIEGANIVRNVNTYPDLRGLHNVYVAVL